MSKSLQDRMSKIHDLIDEAMADPKSDANTKPASFAARMVRECAKLKIKAKSRRIAPKQYSLDVYSGKSRTEIDLFVSTDPGVLAYTRQWDEELKPWLRYS